MKKGIHPESYRMVVFKDMSSGVEFLTRSCVNTRETTTHADGNEYPLYKLDISSASHPFFTGKKMFLDTAGRVEKFNKKYKKA
ncbi:MAG: type B 50S ribosomal protein L31 [Bacteroidetes bacterium]|nr:type B 50S ribosomal protein L31 [Bacteroidota bacterium]